MRHSLTPHPTTRPRTPAFDVWVNVESGCDGTRFTYGVSAPAGRFIIPSALPPERTDDLWQATCFEAFVSHDAGPSYREWNFAPSGRWAAYDFSGYRQSMKAAAVPRTPTILVKDHRKWWTVTVEAPILLVHRTKLGLSAILREYDGTLTYWALAHHFLDKPDFHHPDSLLYFSTEATS